MLCAPRPQSPQSFPSTPRGPTLWCGQCRGLRETTARISSVKQNHGPVPSAGGRHRGFSRKRDPEKRLALWQACAALRPRRRQGRRGGGGDLRRRVAPVTTGALVPARGERVFPSLRDGSRRESSANQVRRTCRATTVVRGRARAEGSSVPRERRGSETGTRKE